MAYFTANQSRVSSVSAVEIVKRSYVAFAEGDMDGVLSDMHPDIEWHQGDVEQLPFADGTYDMVLSQFGHIFAPRPDVAIAEMLRVLKPGGFAVIHHAGGVDIGLSAQSIGRSNVDAPYFKFLAEKNGLEVVEQNTSLPHKPGDVITICRGRPSS